MKRLFLLFAILMFVFSIAVQASGDQGDIDPLARDLIFVEGESEITVPVSGFSLTFSFDIDRGSFTDASNDSNKIADNIVNNIKSLGLSNVQAIKGWDIVKQAKISFGAKGRKISNRFVVKVFDYPEGKLHEIIARSIDKSLVVDSSIALEDINVLISEELENKKKGEVISQALGALQSNAKRTAEAAGKTVVEAKRIFITNDQDLYKNESMSYDAGLYRVETVAAKNFVSVQKSFKVESEIVDQIKITAKVSGVYQIN